MRELAHEESATPQGELEDLLATLRRDLELVAWEITGPQAIPAAKARLGRQPRPGWE